MNTANHIPQDDLALFALQLLPENELSDILSHIEHCEACREEVARFQGDLAVYGLTSELHSPPAQARERLLRGVAREKKLIPAERVAVPAGEPVLPARGGRVYEMSPRENLGARRGSSFLTWAGWAVAAGVAVVAGMQFHERQNLQSTLESETATLTKASGDAARAKDALQALTDGGALQVALHLPPPDGVPSIPVPEGHAAYLASKGSLVFVAANLAPLDANKTYELWLLPEGGQAPIAAGLFKPDSTGSASVVMPDLPRGVAAKGFGVTIEDDGGSRQGPTKPIVLLGM